LYDGIAVRKLYLLQDPQSVKPSTIQKIENGLPHLWSEWESFGIHVPLGVSCMRRSDPLCIDSVFNLRCVQIKIFYGKLAIVRRRPKPHYDSLSEAVYLGHPFYVSAPFGDVALVDRN